MRYVGPSRLMFLGASMIEQKREAVILAGGFGRRLAHIVPGVCKPMALVAGRPFLRYILDQLAEARFGHVVIADGYLRHQIESYFGDSYRGMDIEYSPEEHPLLTGGAAKKALEKCVNDWVFIINGDTFSNVDFCSMEAVAAKKEGSATAVLSAKVAQDCTRYGMLEVTDDGTIVGFSEKTEDCKAGMISSGVYLMARDSLCEMPQSFSLEKGYFEKIVGEGKLHSAVQIGEFIDIGTPVDYRRAQTVLKPYAIAWNLAVFDRDGTINIDTGHLYEPEKLQLIPEVIPLLKRYTDDPTYKVVVATNQAGIAKQLYTVEDMRALHSALDILLDDYGCRIDAYYYCPHHPDVTGACECRKPAPGMILDAIDDYDSTPDRVIMYGDKPTDREAAIAAGVTFEMIGDAS